MTETGFGSGSFSENDVMTPTFRRKTNQEDPFGVGLGGSSPFDITQTDLYKNVQQTATQQMQGNTEAFDAQANIARDAQKAASYEAARAKREQLMGFGLRDTGTYIEQGILGPADQESRERAELERRLSSDRETMRQGAIARGQQTGLNLLQFPMQQEQLRSNQSLEMWKQGRVEALTREGWTQEEARQKAELESRERISTQQTNLEMWKQGRVEELTKQGWTQEEAMQKAELESRESQFSRSLNLDSQKLSETARQFNMTTEQAQQQFSDKLKLDYEQLSQSDRQFLATLGFNREQFDEAKRQFSIETAMRESQFARSYGLDLEKFQEASRQFNITTEEARQQFKDKLQFDYDQLTTQDKQFLASFGLDQAKFEESKLQFQRELDQRVQLAQMQTDLEQWKTDRAEKLAVMGWDRQDAQAVAQRDQEILMFNMNAILQQEIEKGRLSMQDKELAQNAMQFQDEMSFKTWATEQGFANDAAARAWQTSERVASQAFTQSEATIDRQLQREIEEGRISYQDRALAQEAMQFGDRMAFDQYALEKNLDNETATRIWQSAENARSRTHDLQLQQIEGALQEKGIAMSALMSYAESLPPEQAAQIIKQMAADAGITYTVTDVKGNPVYEADGSIKTAPGFPPANPDAPITDQTRASLIQQYNGTDDAVFRNGSETYQKALQTIPEFVPQVGYDSGGFWKPDSRTLGSAPASGSLMNFNGGLYRVTSGIKTESSGENYQYFTVIDLATGQTRRARAAGTTGGKNVYFTIG